MLINRLVNMNFRNKLLFSYIFIVLLPVIFIGFFIINKSKQIILTQTTNINQITFNQMKKNITDKLNNYMTISNSVISDNIFLDDIQSDYTNTSSYLDKYLYTLVNYEKIIRTLNAENLNISIYTNNPTIIPDNRFIKRIDSSTRNEAWYGDVLKGNGMLVITDSYTKPMDYEQIKSWYISLNRLLVDFIHKKYTSLLTIEIPEKEIYKLIEKEGIYKRIYITNQDGNIVSSTVRTSIGKYINQDNELNKIIDQYKKYSKEVMIIGGNLVFCSSLTGNNPINHWNIIFVIPSNLLLEDITSISRYSLLICIISTCISIVFILIFSKKLTKRLSILVNNMKHIQNGSLEVIIDFPEKDEIGELSRSFTSMINRINSLISEVYIAKMKLGDEQIRKKNAEIKALQSQINPHFLFNTMESIRMNILVGGDIKTSNVIESFSKLLRKSIEWGDDLITIRQEIDLVENYLRIQKFRYPNKLNYHIVIHPQIYEIFIPKFTLQPIVENAIYHGIERKEGNGVVVIEASFYMSNVRITVKDDGIGIEDTKLDSIQQQLNSDMCDDYNQIGLNNVHKRLKLYFGNNYGLAIQSKKDIGTTVEVLLPSTNIKNIKGV